MGACRGIDWIAELQLTENLTSRGIFQNKARLSEVDGQAALGKLCTALLDLVSYEDVRHILIPVIVQVDLRCTA